MKNKIKKLALKSMGPVVKNLNKLVRNQRGELPMWVNTLMVIAIVVVIGIIVYNFLPDQLQTLIQGYIDKITNTIV